jgi:hypothetical protein
MQQRHPDQFDTHGESSHLSDEAGNNFQVPSSSPLVSFSVDEWRLIVALRDSYDKGLDLLSPSELARMRFLKWMVDSGRLES